ncbi:MAG: hypothetical protein Q4D85_01175 [Corynebacterium sp.]|uniref:hypothetical protein n=1 Tax=Corynebacterium sp. TaxID=1720 RepID=UPI0026DD824C|nr:hypothetical protein [Corynebacterium sp.]MDO5097339.1 hypothetical protein [Corynebacterium sp.]
MSNSRLASGTRRAYSTMATSARAAVALAAVFMLTSCSVADPIVVTPKVMAAPANATKKLDTSGFHYTPLSDPELDTHGYQITYVNLATGAHIGSANERDSRPALSLIKLYIAHYVFEHGTKEDKELAQVMISKSDDSAADELFATYPESIDSVAKDFNLDSTKSDPAWGYSVTSTYDVAYFLAQLKTFDPSSQVLKTMREAKVKASDGTTQDFGTVVLPGVLGSKWAWSNDKDLHSSASFGHNFVAVAAVHGDAKTLTKLVEYQLLGEGKNTEFGG